MSDAASPRTGLIAELQRRKVVRAAGVYAVAAWLLLQVGDVLVEPMRLPDYTQSLLLALALLGFPLVVLLAWVFESSPDGIVVDSGEGAMPPRTGRTADWLLVAAAVVLVGYSLVKPSDASLTTNTTAQTEPSAEPVLAVLPFENLSPLAENAFFTAGMYEDMLAQLGHVKSMRVIARSSIERLPADLALADVAATLGATHIIEGSVRRAEGRVRIQVKLIEPSSDVQVWAATYDRDLADVFAVQSEVAARIAEELQVELVGTGLPPTDAQTVATDTYDRLLQARQLLDSGRMEGAEAAIELLGMVTSDSPDYAPGWAWLSVALLHSSDGAVWRGQRRERALDAATRALELDAESVDANLAMGQLLGSMSEGRLVEAVPYLEKAVRLAPNNALAVVNLGKALLPLGEINRAAEQLSRAVELDPLNPDLLLRYARALADDQPQRTRELAVRALLLAPDNPGVRANAGFTLLRTGDVGAVLDGLLEGIKLDPGNVALGSFVVYHMTAFEAFDVADRLLLHFEQLLPKHVLVRQRRNDWYLAQRDFSGALQAAEQWLQHAPDEPDAHRYKGTALILLAQEAAREEDQVEAQRLHGAALPHLRLAAARYIDGHGAYTVNIQSFYELVLLGDALRGLGQGEADDVFGALADGLAGSGADGMGNGGAVRARALAELGEIEQALEELEAAGAAGFSSPWILDIAGGAFAQQVVNTPSYQSWRFRIHERNAAVVAQLRSERPLLFADPLDLARL